MITIRQLCTNGNVYLLAEWPDRSPDRSFEGAMYPAALSSPMPKAQETTLLRDELEILLLNPKSRPSGTGHHYGSWIWKSQWQRDYESRQFEAVRKGSRTSYIVDYPMKGDGAFAARYVANTHAITSPASPCRWIVQPAEDVYREAVTRPISGTGESRHGKWRVMLRIPVSELRDLPSDLQIVAAVADGGLAECGYERGVTHPLRLELPGMDVNDGGRK